MKVIRKDMRARGVDKEMVSDGRRWRNFFGQMTPLACGKSEDNEKEHIQYCCA